MRVKTITKTSGIDRPPHKMLLFIVCGGLEIVTASLRSCDFFKYAEGKPLKVRFPDRPTVCRVSQYSIMSLGLPKFLQRISIAVLSISIAPLVTSANETSHFGTLRVTADEPAIAAGYTGGSLSLPLAIANRDREGNLCLGFGDPLPDYQLVLDRSFANLSLVVDSGGRDTTLVVRGPRDAIVRCADDSEDGTDAVLVASDWEPGTYDIWVGAIEPGVQWSYTLSIVP